MLQHTPPQKCEFQFVEHPPYSPDLAPSDCYLFPNIKKELDGNHFARDDDVINAVNHFLRDQNGAIYTEGIRLLHDRWTKCVNEGGDYIEKMTATDVRRLTTSTLGDGRITHASYCSSLDEKIIRKTGT